MSIVSIGADCGGPEAGVVGALKVPLYQALERRVTSSHCAAVDEYAIVLRVDGSIEKFGAEGLARLRFAKARRYITVNVQIPEVAWRGKSTSQLKHYISGRVTEAVRTCVGRLKKEKHHVQESLLFAEIGAASAEYLAGAHDA